MTTYSNTITLNSISLYITSATAIKRQRTIKHVIGKSLIESNVIGLNATQWEITLNGIIYGSSVSDLSNKRNEIEDLDSAEIYAYVDGVHDGDFIVKPESLNFDDTGDSGGLSVKYTMTIVEW